MSAPLSSSVQLPDAPVKLYDPYADAVDRGITVGYLPIESACGTWLPRQNAVVLSSKITDPVNRRMALGHMLVHAELEHTLMVRAHRRGLVHEEVLEHRIRTRAARRFIPLVVLEPALAGTDCAASVARAIGVNVRILLHRVRTLSAAERRWIGHRLVDRLRWPDSVYHPEAFVCCVDAKIEDQRMLLGSLAVAATSGVAAAVQFAVTVL